MVQVNIFSVENLISSENIYFEIGNLRDCEIIEYSYFMILFQQNATRQDHARTNNYPHLPHGSICTGYMYPVHICKHNT